MTDGASAPEARHVPKIDTTVPHSARIWNYADRYATTGAVPYRLRSRPQIAAFFDGLELVEPGLVGITRWRPDPSPFAQPDLPAIGAAGRKPGPAGT